MFVLEEECFGFDNVAVERAAQMNDSPVPATKMKKAQPNLQCPNL